MAVNITWAETSGGSDVNDVSAGDAAAGDTTSEKTLFISHDGVASITNCKVYIGSKTESYAGDATAEQDYNEMLAWGDASVEADFGGLQFNFDSDGGFPASAWGTVSSKSPTNGNTVRTGVGDTKENGIVLPTSTGIASSGIIAVGETASFKVRYKVPSSEGTTGKREVAVKLRYQFTT